MKISLSYSTETKGDQRLGILLINEIRSDADPLKDGQFVGAETDFSLKFLGAEKLDMRYDAMPENRGIDASSRIFSLLLESPRFNGLSVSMN